MTSPQTLADPEPRAKAPAAPPRAVRRGRARTQLLAVVRKETLQTVRDKRMMALLVMAPLLQTLLFGWAVDFQVDRVPTLVVDADHSDRSREHARRLLADGTLRPVGQAQSAEEGDRALDEGRAAVVVLLPPGFGRDLAAGRPASVQVIVDGTDPNRANVAAAAVARYFGEQGVALAVAQLARLGRPRPGGVTVTPRIAWNPELRTPPYMLPAIMGMLLVVVTTIVTAMGLSREREVGTLEQVLVTPIRPTYLLAGKMIPFVCIGLFDVLLVLGVGGLLFHLPIRGSLVLLFTGALLFLMNTLGVGLLIATMSQTQQQAFLAGFLFIMPAMLLSGTVTPIASMPEWLQWVTRVNPLRYFAELTRAVLLKGAGFADLPVQLIALCVIGLAVFSLAVSRFHKTLG